MNRIRYRARVAYDGSCFQGWQYQPNTRTIQGALESTLSQRFNRTVRIVGAGRTDAGVHARGQAIHFDLLETELKSHPEIQQLEKSMNQMLGQEVRVWNLGRAPPPEVAPSPNGTLTEYEWHVIYQAQQKLYSYRLCTGVSMDPLERHTRFHVDWGSVDIAKLERILKLYEGTHDFRAFAGAIEQKEKHEGKPVETFRTVYRVDLVKEGPDLYRVDFFIRGALYKMIRNMMGTAIEVCRGKMSEDTFCQLLYHTDDANDETGTTQFVRKDNPTKPAPPQGLTLERVFFEDDF